MKHPSSLTILGGSSLVAAYLLARLDPETTAVTVVARRRPALPTGVAFVDFGSLGDGDWRPRPGAPVVSLLPLAVLRTVLPRLGEAGAIVALGSTSRFSKAASPVASERAGATALLEAETALTAWATAAAVPWTLLRPTLVYDLVHDRNIARMVRFIRRYRFLPVARPAAGLRQPIHADDVAKAVLGALGNGAAANRAFNVSGGEVLPYRAMAERVFAHLGIRPRIAMLPTGLLRQGFGAAERLGLVREAAFGSSVFDRMNQDLVYPAADGIAALGYDPRPFDLPHAPRPGDLDCRTAIAMRNAS